MSGVAQLEALLEVINASARQAIAEYQKGGNDVPTLHSNTFHPIDMANDSAVLRKAATQLQGACRQVCGLLVPPLSTFVRNFTVPCDWACGRVIVRAKVADALEKYPDGLHVDELAKLVNLEQGKLARLLRFLATRGCFVEVKPNTFANNRVSLVTLSNTNSGAIARMLSDDLSQGATVLYETMTDPEYATSYRPEMAPLCYALKAKGLKGNYFDLLNEDAERREIFHRSMLAGNHLLGALSVLHHYPWKEVKTVCDVGAGIGAISQPLSKTWPHLKITLQDLPEVLAGAKNAWAENTPEVLQDNRVEFVPLNFLEESPARGQDVYYLRNIIHDWPDAQASVILTNVRNAMAPHSRLLVHETAMNITGGDTSAKSVESNGTHESLLPNLSDLAYHGDLIMWLTQNAKERTLDELVVLGSAAGMRLEKVYDLVGTSVVEFRLA